MSGGKQASGPSQNGVDLASLNLEQLSQIKDSIEDVISTFFSLLATAQRLIRMRRKYRILVVPTNN